MSHATMQELKMWGQEIGKDNSALLRSVLRCWDLGRGTSRSVYCRLDMADDDNELQDFDEYYVHDDYCI